MRRTLMFILSLGLLTFLSTEMKAQCNGTSAGILPPNSIITICNGDTFTLTGPSNSQLDTNDGRWFIIFTSPNTPLTTIQQISSDSTFTLNGNPGQSYFYSVIVGDTLADGSPDFDDPCLSVSNFTNINIDILDVELFQGCAFDSIYGDISGNGPFDIFAIVQPGNDTLEYTTNTFLQFSPDYDEVFVRITSPEGCVVEETFVASSAPPVSLLLEASDSFSCTNDVVVLTATVTGGVPPYTFRWPNGGAGGPAFTIIQPGSYWIIVVDSVGCSAQANINVPFVDTDCGIINGNVKWDQDGDCLPTSGDIDLEGWTIAAFGKLDTFYATTQSNGDYQILVAPDTFDVEVITPNNFFGDCNAPVQAIIEDEMDSETVDFMIQSEVVCPSLNVDLGLPALRACVDRWGSIQVCNNGTEAETDVYVEVDLDEKLEITAAQIGYTQVGDTYVFQLGDLDAQECMNFNVRFKTDCDADLGETLCAEARIYPDTLCEDPNPLWSGASLNVTATCGTDSIYYEIKNIGFGPMTEAKQYIVIEDAAIMRISDPFQLGPDESIQAAVPATGSTVRIEVPQEAFHPGSSMPSITLESCGGSPGSFGFVNAFPMNDGNANVDIDCGEVLNSYDPNDKQASPKGYSNNHYIEPNTALEYKIRFQNTGNDTAYLVEIIDTLSNHLDPKTFVAGAASHVYDYEIYENGIVRFTFENINLVDSFTNEPLSHGFVEYKIQQMPDVELGTIIYNAADIYFDQNAPIYTNRTYHEVGEDFILVKTLEVLEPGATVNVFPNPFDNKATLQITLLDDNYRNLELTILDVAGKVIQTKQFDSNQLGINRHQMNTGFYFYTLSRDGKPIANGKIIVR
ncbi:MAG: T9SS type A sorting domain-containing protein [Saprospiraceae bacterium]